VINRFVARAPKVGADSPTREVRPSTFRVDPDFTVTDDGEHRFNVSSAPEIPQTLRDGEIYVTYLWTSMDSPPSRGQVDVERTFDGVWAEPPRPALAWRYIAWGPNFTAPAIHATDTLDLIWILDGDVELRLEDDESIPLTEGDALVIPASAHAWSVGPRGCRQLCVTQSLSPA
jgi:mannose-6-phosphate isomerase-like protein (cupin superfamily)